MELKEAIKMALDGQALLFAGAGFSYGAENIKGVMPSGNGLKKTLLKELDLPEDINYNLEVVSDYYQDEKTAEELVQVLKEQFNVVKIKDYHKTICGVHWKRIYTTNYDQVVEKASIEGERKIIRMPVVLSDNFQETEKDNICVHLNGYIERLNPAKIQQELKLTDRSYSCDSLVGNPWFEFMINDFKSASAIIVIGYSMQFDIDIKRLFSAPEISQKVVFIDSPYIDKISKTLLEHYGTCQTIGIQGFSEEILEVTKTFVPSVDYSYKSFRYSYKKPLEAVEPTYEEIVECYLEGKVSDNMFLKDGSGEYKYLLERSALSVFMRNYRNKKVYIVLSNLGNGKSIFCDIIEKELNKEDVKIFRYLHRYSELDMEIENICKEKGKKVIIIDNYPGHMDILNKFYLHGHSNIVFVLSARNAVNMMFCRQLTRALHIEDKDICPLYLNKMQDREVEKLGCIFENNSLLTEDVFNQMQGGTLSDFITTECQRSFSNLLLKLFNASSIKEKLIDLYSSVKNTKDIKIKQVIIFSLLKNISNYDINFIEILDLFEADYVALKRHEIEFIPEIFDGNSQNQIAVRSSVVSQVIVKEIIEMKDIVDVMIKAFLAADCKHDRTYKELQKSMVSHSQFIVLVNKGKEKEYYPLIETFYDSIRNTKFAKNNPFFWEQFASSYIDMKKYHLVEKCINTALVEAKKIRDFVPFQIKTVQGRFYVEKAYDDILKEKIAADAAINAIVKATDSILEFYNHPENNLYYVFKVVKIYPLIFNLIKSEMDDRLNSIYIEKGSVMRKLIEQYLDTNEETQYFARVKKWCEELEETLTIAKESLKH